MMADAKKIWSLMLNHGTDFEFGVLGEYFFVSYADEKTARSMICSNEEEALELEKLILQEARQARDNGTVAWVGRACIGTEVRRG